MSNPRDPGSDGGDERTEGQVESPLENVVQLRVVKDRALERLEEVLKEVRTSPGWLASADAQARSLQFLIDHGNYLPRDDFDALSEAIRSRLQIPPSRFRLMLRLDRLEDLAAALRFQASHHTRLDVEQVYPKDGWIGAYLLWSQGSEVPLGWHFWMATAVLGAAARRSLYIPMGNHIIHPNQYLLFIGPTGMRKSTAIKTGRQVVTRLNDMMDLRDVEADRRIKVLPDKITPERFLQMMSSRTVPTEFGDRRTESCAMVCPDELTVLLGRSAFHSDMFIHLLTALYDCPEEWSAATILRQDDKLYNVAITFVGGSTPDWIRTSVSEDMFGGGFMGRCVFVYRESSGRRFPRPDPLDPVTRDFLAETLLQWVNLNRQAVSVTKQTWDVYDEWYCELAELIEQGDVEERMRGYFVRKPTHVLRLATLLAMSMDRTTIQARDFDQALKIVDHEESYLEQCFAEMALHEDARWVGLVKNTIRRNGNLISRNDLNRKTYRYLGSSQALDRVLATLQDHRELETQYDPANRTTYFSIRTTLLSEYESQ